MKLDANNPLHSELMKKTIDPATGKSLMQLALEDSKKHAQKMNQFLDHEEQVKKAFESAPEPKKKKSRYSNERVEIDGHKFDSKKEAERWKVLYFEQRSGLVKEIEHHRIFKLVVNGVKITTYEADFVYKRRDAYGNWRRVVEDVKESYFLKRKGSADYRLYRMKKSLMLALYGITITELT